ncbi:hypothetical protein ACWFMI_18250 [Nocardiopsis terrae]
MARNSSTTVKRAEPRARRGTVRAGGPGTRGGRGPGPLTALALALVLPVAFAAPAAAEGAEPGTTESGAVAARDTEGAAPTSPNTVSQSLSHRHYYSTWRDARTYWSQGSRYPTSGWLWAGRHYFFCQVEGEPHTDGESYSTWWALTDDDTGNRDVFVSATAFRDHEPWQPVQGLPRC